MGFEKIISKVFRAGILGETTLTSAIVFYAYVLRSLSADFYYKGHCKDLDDRLQQHNSGMTRSIRNYIPFEMAYFEEFEKLEEHCFSV